MQGLTSSSSNGIGLAVNLAHEMVSGIQAHISRAHFVGIKTKKTAWA
jgi:hypothetical protein